MIQLWFNIFFFQRNILPNFKILEFNLNLYTQVPNLLKLS